MITSKYINKLLAAGVLCTGLGLSSCEDYLTVLPTDKEVEEGFWKSKTDLESVRAAAYRQMATSAVTDRIIYWGELRADNASLNDLKQQSIQLLQQAILMPTEGMFDWSAFYTGINYCNLVIEKGDEMTAPGNEIDPTFRLNDWKPIKAEMLALRSLYYFYLVRAYRDVPYVVTPVRTDEEAKSRRDGSTPGVNILGKLIADLEEALPYSADNFGSAANNAGRFTERGVRALLADMYLWRACMVMNAIAQGTSADPVLDAEDQPVADLEALKSECFTKCKEHCDAILAYFQKEYDEEQEAMANAGFSGSQNTANVKYPYLQRMYNRGVEGVQDDLYQILWTTGTSHEAIFELKYDGEGVKNGTYNNFFCSLNSGSLVVGTMNANSILSASASSSYAPTVGYGKTDLRLLQTLAYDKSSSSRSVIHKNMLSSYSVENLEDVSEGIASSSPRSQNSMNFPIYRLPEIMLIKAEAIARSMSADKAANDSEFGASLVEGFQLVNTLFGRSNPALQPTADAEIGKEVNLKSDRMRDDYATIGTVKTAANLLDLVYRERQREFVAEGKRWFDLVRQCEATNSPTDVLQSYIVLSTTVRNRLRSLYSLYNPVYSEEIKVNGVEQGGNLKQNPVWDRYTSK